jgi:hypothetical protein
MSQTLFKIIPTTRKDIESFTSIDDVGVELTQDQLHEYIDLILNVYTDVQTIWFQDVPVMIIGYFKNADDTYVLASVVHHEFDRYVKSNLRGFLKVLNEYEKTADWKEIVVVIDETNPTAVRFAKFFGYVPDESNIKNSQRSIYIKRKQS